MVCSEIILTDYWKIIIAVAGFTIIVVASRQIAGLFQKLKLPLVTGMLFMGIVCGPYILDLISFESSSKLDFINNISLAFIAFAAGSELYLKELRSRFQSIRWMTTWQLIITFLVSSIIIFSISDMVPFMQHIHPTGKIAVAMLISTIFVARSPATLISVINELRAKGPFTHTALGVTVLIDVLVIILFAITFSLANTLLTGIKFNLQYLLILSLELSCAFGVGFLLGRFLGFILSRRLSTTGKAILILLLGYGTYLLSHFLRLGSTRYLSIDFYIEPLLVCIVTSFIVTNYTRYRREYLKIIHDTLPYIYVAFFTLVGATWFAQWRFTNFLQL